MASYLLYVPQFFRDVDLSRWPNVVRYMKDCAVREYYAKAFGENTQQVLLASLENMGDSKKQSMFGGLF